MAITKEDVIKVAGLARLNITDDKAEVFTTQLARILEHVEKLSEVDTTGVEPTTSTVPLVPHMREDKVKDSLTNEEALKNSASSDNGSFKVPKIIE